MAQTHIQFRLLALIIFSMSQLAVTRAFSLFDGSFMDFKRVFFCGEGEHTTKFTVAEASEFITNYDSNINKHM